MKKIKSLACILMAIMLVATVFTFSVSALDPDQRDVTLHVTKYQIKQMNGETDRIGNTDLTGTTADAPQNAVPLSGAEFTIFKLGDLDTYVSDSQIAAIDATYDAAAKTIKFNGATISGTSKTTGEDGTADFTVSAANQGLYFVKETKSPDAVTAKAASFVVNLPMTNTTDDGFMYDVYVYPKNYTTLGGGILQKVDSSQNKKLSGAKFALYKADGADGTQVTEDYYGNPIGDSTNHYLTTDANGYIYVNNLLVGSYYFQETVAPDNYILKSDKYNFSVETGKSTEVIALDTGLVYDGITLLTADNSGKPGVNKYVTEVGQKEDNVEFDKEFTWIIISDVPSDMGTAYTKYELVDTMDAELDFVANSVTVSTSADGTNYTPFDSANYTVSAVANQKFTVSFTNFTALKEAKKVKVEYKTTLNKDTTVMGDDIYNNVTLNYKTDVVEDSAKENNPPKVYTGGFKFLKVSQDNTTTLAGAVFDVYDANDVKVRENVTSDADGKFEVKGLKDGEYYLVETKAPAGHELKVGKVNFTVTKTSYDNVTALNVINIPTSKLPITGGMGTALFTGIGLSLIALAVVFFVISRKSKKSK